jgi:O-antigen/teichoic acid export membrane protein
MATTTRPLPLLTLRRHRNRPAPSLSPQPATLDIDVAVPRRMTHNFLALSAAEVACRGTSVAVTFCLARRLGAAGYGRIEFAFNIVFWLVLVVRDGLEVIAAREIARHPRLVRPLVNHVLALKVALALGLLLALVNIGILTFSGFTERWVLSLYGLMLLTTALGLDFVYRGQERMSLVAISLLLRTAVYAAGVWTCVMDITRIVWVPAWLVAGEAVGIGMVWACYIQRHGWPRPTVALGGRFVRVFVRRGRQVFVIQVAQTVIGSIDFLVVGLLSPWVATGIYGFPHRMAAAALNFCLIVQQVAFPALARSWRAEPDCGRRSLDALVRVLVLFLVPVGVGTSVLAVPLVRALLPADYAGAGTLLALTVWRAPLLTLAFLYQTALIALNRESAGVRLLLAGALTLVPLVALLRWMFGLPGAAAAVLVVGLALVVAGHRCLACLGRQPSWHHHLPQPLLASLAMVPACLVVARYQPLAAVPVGAVIYFLTLSAFPTLRVLGLPLTPLPLRGPKR